MHIMSAGMHDARMLGFIWSVVEFLYGQGVHICSEGYTSGLRVPAAQQAHHSCTGYMSLDRDIEFLELGCYQSGGAGLLFR
jgi:hypothetical protein